MNLNIKLPNEIVPCPTKFGTIVAPFVFYSSSLFLWRLCNPSKICDLTFCRHDFLGISELALVEGKYVLFKFFPFLNFDKDGKGERISPICKKQFNTMM